MPEAEVLKHPAEHWEQAGVLLVIVQQPADHNMCLSDTDTKALRQGIVESLLDNASVCESAPAELSSVSTDLSRKAFQLLH